MHEQKLKLLRDVQPEPSRLLPLGTRKAPVRGAGESGRSEAAEYRYELGVPTPDLTLKTSPASQTSGCCGCFGQEARRR